MSLLRLSFIFIVRCGNEVVKFKLKVKGMGQADDIARAFERIELILGH
jgi:hypothetical protein